MKVRNIIFLPVGPSDTSKFVSALKKLYTQELPISISFSLNKSIKAIDAPLSLFLEARQGLFKKYGAQDGTNIIIKSDNVQKFNNDLLELVNIETDVNIEKIDLEKLKELDIKISAEELDSLSILFNGIEEVKSIEVEEVTSIEKDTGEEIKPKTKK